MDKRLTTSQRPPKKRVIRASKTSQAREAIGTINAGCELFIFTYGQFSLIDAICELVRQTGPADVTLSTWTAADADLRRSHALLQSAQIKSMRYIVDRSFATRMPWYCTAMREMFGADCIRTVRSHAKFCTIKNERWNLAIRTSMNLNHNPRLENIEISDDVQLCDFLTAVADEIFSEQAPGTMDGELPLLRGLTTVDGAPLEHGEIEKAGLVRPAIA